VPRITASKAEQAFAETLNRVASKRERLILHRQGKDIAAIVPMKDLAALEEMEDRLDLEEAKKALAEAKKKGEKPIPWARAKKELGL
jgi:prevent-host-death family protein